MSEDVLDGGYGLFENIELNIFLSTLPSESKLIYEDYLKKQDKEKYKQFKEWQKEIGNNG